MDEGEVQKIAEAVDIVCGQEYIISLGNTDYSNVHNGDAKLTVLWSLNLFIVHHFVEVVRVYTALLYSTKVPDRPHQRFIPFKKQFLYFKTLINKQEWLSICSLYLIPLWWNISTSRIRQSI